MAIKKSKYNRALKSLVRKPSVLGFLALVVSLLHDFVNHNMHERVFSSRSVNVVDGDTIILGGSKIRLQGLDAPELKQECVDNNTKHIWPCGLKSKLYLEKLIGKKTVSCTDEGRDKYGRQLSYCYVGEINVNREIVRAGYAVAYTKFDALFFVDEMIAKYYKRGIWSSSLEEPESWRRSRSKK